MTSRALQWLVIAAMFVALLASFGCCPRATVKPDPGNPPAISISRSGCLTRPPPAVVPREIASTCPPHVCIPDADYQAIATELRARRAWDESAWIKCSMTPPPPSP